MYFWRGQGGKKEGEKYQCEREASNGCLSHVPGPGMEPTTQAHALTRKWTRDLLLWGTMPNQLSHTSQGLISILKRGKNPFDGEKSMKEGSITFSTKICKFKIRIIYQFIPTTWMKM